MGIEPTCPAWKAGALPLSYTRGRLLCGSLRNRFLLNRVEFEILGQPCDWRRVFQFKSSGGRRIRTSEGCATRFTVWPIWPLWNSPGGILFPPFARA